MATPAGNEIWRVRVDGGIALTSADRACVTPRSRKARALVAYLALQPGHRASRERLIALLWSNRGREQARASLRQCLHELRVEAPGLIEAETDVVVLAAAIAETGHPPQLEGLEQLDPAFDRWLETLAAKSPANAPAPAAAGASPRAMSRSVKPAALDAPTHPGQTSRKRAPVLAGLAAAAVLALAGVVWVRLVPAGRVKPTVGIVALEAIPDDAPTRALADRVLDQAVEAMPAHRAVFRRADRGGRPPTAADWTMGGAIESNPHPAARAWIRDSSGADLWSTSTDASAGDLEAAARLATGRLAKVVTCALGGPARRRPADVLALLFAACEQINLPVETDEAKRLVIIRRFAAGAPDDALAHAMLGTSLAIDSGNERDRGLNKAAVADLVEAKTESARALALDRRTGEAYLVPTWLAFFVEDFATAEKHALQGLSVEPDNPQLVNIRGTILASVGRTRESLAYAERARALDPIGVAKIIHVALGLADEHEPRAALTALDEAESRFPGNRAIAEARLAILVGTGDVAAARAALDRAAEPPNPMEPDVQAAARLLLVAMASPRGPTAATVVSNNLANAAQGEPAASDALTTLAAIGRYHDAEIVAERWPIETRRLFSPSLRPLLLDERFVRIARRQRLWDYWQATGQWPDICSDPALRWHCGGDGVKRPSIER